MNMYLNSFISLPSPFYLFVWRGQVTRINLPFGTSLFNAKWKRLWEQSTVTRNKILFAIISISGKTLVLRWGFCLMAKLNKVQNRAEVPWGVSCANKSSKNCQKKGNLGDLDYVRLLNFSLVLEFTEMLRIWTWEWALYKLAGCWSRRKAGKIMWREIPKPSANPLKSK